MIDVEVDLFNKLATAIIEEFPDVYISSEHVLTPPMFPAVFIEQTFSSEVDQMRDSSGEENGNAIIWTFNIYSNSESDASGECRRILQIADTIMRRWNFKRLTARPTDNAADPSIYRYVGRYTGIIDKRHITYWR